MASRREVEQRRNDLHRDLRQPCRDGSLEPDAPAPPVRELAERYGLSNNVAHRAVQELIREGTLYSVPGVGTFVQRRQTQFRALSGLDDVWYATNIELWNHENARRTQIDATSTQ